MKVKKLIALFTAAVLLIVCLPVCGLMSFGVDTDPAFTVTAGEIEDGLIPVRLTLKNCVGLKSGSLYLDYDPEVLTYSYAELGEDASTVNTALKAALNTYTGLDNAEVLGKVTYMFYFLDRLNDFEGFKAQAKKPSTLEIDSENFEAAVFYFELADENAYSTDIAFTAEAEGAVINGSKKVCTVRIQAEPVLTDGSIVLQAQPIEEGVLPVKVIFQNCVGYKTGSMAFTYDPAVLEYVKTEYGADALEVNGKVKADKNVFTANAQVNTAGTLEYTADFSGRLWNRETFQANAQNSEELPDINSENFEAAVFYFNITDENAKKTTIRYQAQANGYEMLPGVASFKLKTQETYDENAPQIELIAGNVEDDLLPVTVVYKNCVDMTNLDLHILFDPAELAFDYFDNGSDALELNDKIKSNLNSYSQLVNPVENGDLSFSAYFLTSLMDQQGFEDAAKYGNTVKINSNAFEACVLYFRVLDEAVEETQITVNGELYGVLEESFSRNYTLEVLCRISFTPTNGIIYKNGYLFTTTETSLAELINATGGKTCGIYADGKATIEAGPVKNGMRLVLKQQGVIKDEIRVIVLGDIDCDGLLTAADSRLALRQTVGLEHFTGYQLYAGCINGTTVTSADARCILRATVGLEKPADWLKL